MLNTSDQHFCIVGSEALNDNQQRPRNKTTLCSVFSNSINFSITNIAKEIANTLIAIEILT